MVEHVLGDEVSARWRSSARRVITPSPTAPWGSACSTTSRSAAAHARASGVGRVAIVDYDVHHGNGTQRMFEDDPAMLYVSMHQYPFYPGTGAASEIGLGAAPASGQRPLEAGASDEDYA